MNNWINLSSGLTGEIIDIIPLERMHFPELERIAKDKRIWEFYAFDGSDSNTLRNTLEEALIEKEKGTQFPFVIVHRKTGRVIGSTRFMHIQAKNQKLEIGTTWLLPEYWGTAVNPECKLLLLTYCFETLNTLRVQLKTDEKNIRSRKAIERIGGQFEGILRNDMVRADRTRRNSAYYSIIEEEWNEKKTKLVSLFQRLKKMNH